MSSKKKQKPSKTKSKSSKSLPDGPGSNPATESESLGGSASGGSEGLKEFVSNVKEQHYHVVEMRILTVCSLGVFYKLFMADTREEQHQTMVVASAFIFIALNILVVMASTWLDYFPTRLVEVKPRTSDVQGLPMGLLLLPMTCCAHLYFAVHSAKATVGLVHVYLVILCVLSACTILATLFHFIAHPTHVVFYNFSFLGITYALYHFIQVPLWLTLPAVGMYSLLGVWLLQNIPETFTLGELVIVSQGITILTLDTGLQLVALSGFVSLPEFLVFFRSESILFLELLLMGVALCCLLLSPALYKIAGATQQHERKFWSATFILLSLSVGLLLVLPWLGQLLGGHHPIPFILFNCVSHRNRVLLLVLWVIVCGVTGAVVWAQSSSARWAESLKVDGGTVSQRKIFHVAGVVIYLLGILLDARFTALVSSCIFFLFVVLELCRVFDMWPFGDSLRQFFQRFADERDGGMIVVSNLYLLLGMCLSLWLLPLRTFNKAVRLAMYSGVLSLGIGDTVASVIGKRYGRVKWKGTKKTLVGSLAFVMSQLFTVAILSVVDPHLGWLSARQWVVLGACALITAAMEAYTWQIDNLTLPLLQHTLFIAFLG